MLPPLRIGTTWGAAVWLFLWPIYQRHGFPDPYAVAGTTSISGADQLRVMAVASILTFLSAWVISAPIFLFIRSRHTLRLVEVGLAVAGAGTVLGFAIFGT